MRNPKLAFFIVGVTLILAVLSTVSCTLVYRPYDVPVYVDAVPTPIIAEKPEV